MDDALPLMLAALIALGAGFFRGFAGFGSGLMMAPLMTLIFPPSVVVPVLVILSLVGDSRLLPEVYREVNVRRVLWLAVPALFGLPLGIAALAVLDAEVVRMVVNSLVLLLVVALARGIHLRGAGRRRVLAPAGFVSGVLTGIGGVGGPPVVLTFLSLDEPANETRANLIGYFAASGVSALVMMATAGVFTVESLKIAGICAIPFFVSIHLGSKIFRHAGSASYRKTALVFLACVAVVGLAWPH